MSLRNFIKKAGKRAAGAWGRINHKKQMRAESKYTRKEGHHCVQEELRMGYPDDITPKKTMTLEEYLAIEDAEDREMFDDPRDYH
jgi:hypothetical protein